MSKNKKLWVFALMGAIGGMALGFWRSHSKRDPLAELFPAEKIQGYMEGTRVRIASNLGSKSITGKEVLVAEAITSGPIEISRLHPTGLSVLKGLLQQRRNAEWICVYLAEDSNLAATANWSAVAEYHRGQVYFKGGPPTTAQVDSLKALGLAAIRPNASQAAMINALFEANPGLKAERWRLSQSLRGASTVNLDRASFFRLEMETRSLASVAKMYGLSGEQLRTLILGVTRYYWLRAGELWEL